MNLTQDWIQNKAANPAVFSRAQSFYRSSAKIEYYVTYTSPDQVEITAKVIDGKDLYHVNIQLDQKDHTSEEQCDCGGFHTKFGACKHVIVTLLKVYDDQRRNQLVVHTTPKDEADLMQQLIEAYEAKLFADSQVSSASEVELHPKLVFSSDLPQLEISIGTNRPYVVRDIYKFAYDVLNENWVSYGKELQFKHSLQDFESKSKSLATLICSAIQEYEIYANPSAAPKSSRSLELTPTKLDDFFNLYINQTIESDKTKQIVLEDNNPPLEIQLLEDTDTYELGTSLEEFQLVKGQQYWYLIHENKMYRCSQDFIDLHQPIIETLTQSPSFRIPFPKADLGKFLSYVPSTQELVSDTILENFKNHPLQTKFYLDVPQKTRILMGIEFCYGDIKISPSHEDSFQNHPNLLRDIKKEREILGAVSSYHFFRTETGDYELKGDENIYAFIHHGVDELNNLGEVYASKAMKDLKINEPQSFSMGVRLQNNWIHLNFEDLGIDAGEYQHIINAYRQRKDYFRLKDGSFLSLEDPSIQKLASLVDDLNITDSDIEGDEILVPSYRAMYLEQFTKLNPEMNLKAHISFDNLIHAFEEVEEADYTVPKTLKNTLRNYQETGFRWLKTLANYRFGGILADDMGLGKTLQVITLLLSEEEQFSLIVTPSSLMYNWKREIEKFAPELKVLVVRGEPNQRQLLIENCQEYDVVVTSYDLIRRDIEHYEKQHFRYCILDEAHYIKNHTTKSAKAVKKIQSDVHLALTGTPIENSLSDLWSIFDFVLPGYLGSYSQFKKKYETPIIKNQEQELLDKIHHQVAPFILRRLKTDVLKELPPKIETNLYCEMDKEQEELYMATLYQMKQSLDQEIKEKGFQQSRMQVLTHLMRLRQLCCHPSLYLENYPGESAKFKMCMQLIDDCMASNHKVLIFSQFTSMLDLLAEELTKQNIPYFMLTGSTPPEKRLELAEQFNQDETPIFLISLKAGGTGLNLTGADVVIHYDPWWNMSAQNQATDRAHRIGQERSVQVFKLITKETIEEKIEELQQRKCDLTEAVIKEGETFINGLNDEEIMALFERDE